MNPAELDADPPHDDPGLFGLEQGPEQARVVVLPVPWDATVPPTRRPSEAPRAVLEASRRIGLLDRELAGAPEAGLAMLPIGEDVLAWNDQAREFALPVIAAGGAGHDSDLRRAAAAVDALADQLGEWIGTQARARLEARQLVGVVGGEASVSLGLVRVLAEREPGLGLLHVAARPGLREAHQGFRSSYASIMNTVLRDTEVARLVQVGLREHGAEEDELMRSNPERVRAHFDADLRRELLEGENFGRLCGRIVSELPRSVYVAFDVAGLERTLCPHADAPGPGGFSFAEVSLLLRKLVESGRRIVGFDLSGVTPDPTGRSEWDAEVGARLLYRLIGYALRSARD